ncbi:hypothetical protein HYU22_00905 [Candidatus Woesearchaeota archaeon]|nr:hypothetical protein [Candidatus Woesearchaeota archaeon]
MAIADTDFLSSFIKIKRTNLIPKAFNTNKITIVSSVLHELEKAPFFDNILNLIDSKALEIKNIEGSISSEEFGAGEMESIALAEQTSDILLMSDQSATRYAEQKGVTVLDIPTFLLYCKKKKILSKIDIQEIIRELKEKDYYEFSDEVKQTLLA